MPLTGRRRFSNTENLERLRGTLPFAKEFHFASQALLASPNFGRCKDGSTFEGVFKNYKHLRESWEHPERFIENDERSIEWEAATDADFEEE